jgi:hypothetical protein
VVHTTELQKDREIKREIITKRKREREKERERERKNSQK